MLNQLEIDSPEFSGEYKDSTGRTLPCYHLDRFLTEVLVTGYDVKRRAAVIKRWHDLETGAATPLHLMDSEELIDESHRLASRMSIVDTLRTLKERADQVASEREWLEEQQAKLYGLLEADTTRQRYRESRRNPGRVQVVPEGSDVTRVPKIKH